MRRQDGEPGGAPPVRRRATGRWLLPLVVAGAAVVVLSTALEGPASVVPLFGANDGVAAPPTRNAGAPSAPLPQGGARIDIDPVLLRILIALGAIVALAVAVVLIRLIVQAILERRRRPRRMRHGVIEVDGDPAVADAPTVLRGIAAALAAFDEDREPSDAVIRAWLGLQQAAEDAGLARSPAETPTEFTGRVLSRTGADRAATRTLLGLYLRARFGGVVITSADASAAQQALRALETSWERVDA